MTAFYVGLWFVSGIIGSAIGIYINKYQGTEIGTVNAWLAVLGPIMLLVALGCCVQIVYTKEVPKS